MSRPPAEPAASPAQFVVDAKVLANGGLTWERQFSDIRFERLEEAALSATPGVAIQLQFGLLDQRPVIHGEMNASIELLCQRCLKPMHYPAHESFDLMLVEQEAELGLVPETHEPWVAHSARLEILALVEEQLLLSLPLIARHVDEQDCAVVSDAVDATPSRKVLQSMLVVQPPGRPQDVQRPFGNLRDLMGKKN